MNIQISVGLLWNRSNEKITLVKSGMAWMGQAGRKVPKIFSEVSFYLKIYILVNIVSYSKVCCNTLIWMCIFLGNNGHKGFEGTPSLIQLVWTILIWMCSKAESFFVCYASLSTILLPLPFYIQSWHIIWSTAWQSL